MYDAGTGRNLESFVGTSRFEVLRPLGVGGMGVVYEALDRERNARVALKTLRSLNAEALLRFKNEFREFQDLQHPNLVSIGELFCENSEWFFSMELVDGVSFLAYVRPGLIRERAASWDAHGSAPPDESASSADTVDSADTILSRIIKPPSSQSSGTFHEARLREALRQLALGLCALHDAGKVHRDIKPSNVLVTPHGRVVLLDFGLAADHVSREHKSEVDIVGTIEYMAPEQAAARQVGPPADWYATGVMLYEALTGQVPLTGPAIEVLMNKQRLDAPSPRVLSPNAPEDLSKLCADLLRFNPSERPTGKHVLEVLGMPQAASSSASLSSFSTSSQFIGRERELFALREAYDRAQKGGQVMAVYGESGVGKSALVRRFTEITVARDPAVVVLRGTCYERESVPFKAVDGMIDALSRYMRRLPKAEAAALLPRKAGLLAQVFPVLARVEAVAEAPRSPAHSQEPQELRNHLFGALRELFIRLSDRHPVVLVIDDLQWADADSLALLAEVMRPPEAPALLVLATVRSGSDGTRPSFMLPGLCEVHVERLPPGEARELAAALLGRAKAETGLKPHLIAQEAAGHPLFIDELIRHACSVGIADQSPLDLEEALWARVQHLDTPARSVLELICLASGRLVQQTAAQAVGMGFGDFAKQVALLRVAHLLRTTGMRATDFVEPYHGRVRTAVTEHLQSDQVRSHQRRIALALETSGQSDPDALAVHWREAGDREKAAHYAVLAAEKAARALAFDRAVRSYQMFLELSPERPRTLLVRLAEALANAGRGGDAGRMYLEASQGASPGESLDLRRRAAEQLLRSGHLDEGMDAIRDVLKTVGMKLPRTPKGALASLVLRRALVRMGGLGFTERDESQLSQETLSQIDICAAVSAGLGAIDTIRGADFQARELLLALKAGEPSRVVRALAMETTYVGLGGSKTRRRCAKLLETATALAQRLGSPPALGLTTFAAGTTAFLDGRFADGHRLNIEAETIFRERCTGATWELDTVRFMSLWCAFYRGDVDDLVKRVPAYLRDSETRGDLYAMVNLRTAFSPFLMLLEDKPEQARREPDEALSRWSREGFHLQHFNGLLARVLTDLYEEKAKDASVTLSAGWGLIERSLLLQVQQIRIRAVHVRGCVALAGDDVDGALAAARKLDKEGTAWASALAAVLRAGCAAQRSESKASDAYISAAGQLDEAGMALYAACARRRASVVARVSAESLATVDRQLADRRVRNPARLTAALTP